MSAQVFGGRRTDPLVLVGVAYEDSDLGLVVAVELSAIVHAHMRRGVPSTVTADGQILVQGMHRPAR
jgi:hypothetical protein